MAEAVTDKDETLTWSGRAVDTAQIEAELARLRFQAAGEPAGGEGFAIRTSLLNLVAYAENEESARQASRTIEVLAGHHPSRALIVIARPAAGDSRIDAQLAAHCHISASLEQQVCCEEVTLTISGPAAQHLHSIIIPLLVPDLPVYVWWTGRLPRARHMFEQLIETADKIIVDSASFTGRAGLQRLAQLCPDVAGCPLGDLNWERLAPWRRVLAQSGEMSGTDTHAEPVSAVAVGYAGSAKGQVPAQTLLILGWLATRLGWDTAAAQTPASGGLIVPAGRQQVSIRVTPEGRGAGAPAGLVSVQLQGRAGGLAQSVSISRAENPLHLSVVREERGSVLESHALIEMPSQSEMLMMQLDREPHDPEYTGALQKALPLLAALST